MDTPDPTPEERLLQAIFGEQPIEVDGIPTRPKPAAAPKLIGPGARIQSVSLTKDGPGKIESIESRSAARSRASILRNEKFAANKKRVKELKARGMSNVAIAEAMHINESTVRSLLIERKAGDTVDVTFEQKGTGMKTTVKHLYVDKDTIIDVDSETGKLPPINLESPDKERVLTVTDLVKAQSMVNKGWTLTDRKKTPYKAPEHLTDRPLADNPALEALRKSMQNTTSKRPATKRATQTFKENSVYANRHKEKK